MGYFKQLDIKLQEGKTMGNTGIDYGRGLTNIDHETGIIYKNHISLMLRTVQDTLRHGLTEGQREALEDMCKEARELLKRGN